MKRILYFFVTTIVLFVAGIKVVNASEGNFILYNRVGESARCEAHSVLMQDRSYNILLTCRDIIYPGGVDVFSYVVWANPVDGGNPFRLGDVGLGKDFFRTGTPFNAIFITKEPDDRVGKPTGTTVMSGNLTTSTFLDSPNINAAPPSQPGGNELGTPETSPTPSPTPAPRNVGSILAAGGLLAFIALFGIILVIFVITRRR